MRRYGYGVSEELLRRLVREIVTARAPDQVGLLDKIGSGLDDETRESLREILASELVETGLQSDDEPNERGLLIEGAIAWLGHQ
jgi:hypothetical protein